MNKKNHITQQLMRKARKIFATVAIVGIAFTATLGNSSAAYANGSGTTTAPMRYSIQIGWGGCSGCSQ
jgi:hypothetical protein